MHSFQGATFSRITPSAEGRHTSTWEKDGLVCDQQKRTDASLTPIFSVAPCISRVKALGIRRSRTLATFLSSSSKFAPRHGLTLQGGDINWVATMLSIRKTEPAAAAVARSPLAPPPFGGRSVTSGPSVIGADLSIVGNLMSGGELHIHGTVQGDIQGVNVLVRETAKIAGTITGHDVIVHGEVMGSVKAERVVLAASCKLEGDVFHKLLSIEQGAFFEGKSRRGSPQCDGAATKLERPPFAVDAPAPK